MALKKSYPAGTFRPKFKLGGPAKKGVGLRKVLAGRIRKLRNTPKGDIGGAMRNRSRAERVGKMIGYDTNKIDKANSSRYKR